MMQYPNLILFDDPGRVKLLPLTFTRPAGELRIGISTIREKWELLTGQPASYLTEEYLSEKFPCHIREDNLFINGRVIPDDNLIQALSGLKTDEILSDGEIILAYRSVQPIKRPDSTLLDSYVIRQYNQQHLVINNCWDIFGYNDEVLRDDFARITKNRKSQPLSSTNRILGAENIFMEEGARVECAIINATNGPVYIGKDAEIMEGAVIRDPLALCEHSTIKMGAKIYGATTIGPHCKVGGEVQNVVFIGFSNKAHDGYLGNSVIGEWCNLGADSNNSNLKNNYASVRLWDYSAERFADTELQFCGLIMGDHSKCGINTMFNTGTVVGVSANIFGSGFPRNFIPSFSWGGAAGFSVYQLVKAFETAEIVFARRKLTLTDADRRILKIIFDKTDKYRKF